MASGSEELILIQNQGLGSYLPLLWHRLLKVAESTGKVNKHPVYSGYVSKPAKIRSIDGNFYPYFNIPIINSLLDESPFFLYPILV